MEPRSVTASMQPGDTASGHLKRLPKLRSVAAFVVSLAALLLVFYRPFLTNRASFYVLDFPGIWYPLLTYTGERLRHWQWPLWNPFVLIGIPQMFSPTICYPLNWLFAFFSFNTAMALVLVAQQVIAGIGMLLLVFDLGLGTLPAVLAGLAFALCGLMFAMQVTYTLQGPCAWFPLTFWGLRLIDRGNARSKLLFTTLSVACSFTLISAGMVEVFAPAFLILLGYSLRALRSKQGSLRSRRIVCGLRLLALVLGGLLAAPVILPQAEWAAHSLRSIGFDVNEAMRQSASWYDLACLFLWQPFNDLYTNSKFYSLVAAISEHDPKMFVPFLAGPYISPVLISLAIWAAWDRSWSARGIVLIGLAVAAIAALGWHTPLAPWVVSATHLSALRFPIKLLIWVVLPLIILSARGLFLLEGGLNSAGLAIGCVLWLLLLIAGGISMLDTSAVFCSLSHWDWAQRNIPTPEVLRALARASVVASALGIATSLVYFLRIKQRIDGRLASWGILSTAAVLILANAWRFDFHPGPTDFYKTSIVMANQAKELLRQEGQLHMPRICVINQLPSVPPWFRWYASEGFNNRAYYRQMLLRMTGMSLGIDDVFSPINGQTLENGYLWNRVLLQHEAGDDRPLSSMCKVCAADFVCDSLHAVGGTGGGRRLDSKYFQVVLENQQLNFVLYRVIDGLPRTYLARTFIWGSPHKAVVKLVAHPQTADFDPARWTVIEKIPGLKKPAAAPPVSSRTFSPARLVIDEPEHLVIDVKAAAPSLLVVSDQYYPGWLATVDGKAQPIHISNGVTRGVFVDAGSHTVELVYQPLSVSIAVWLASFALLFLGGIVILALAMPQEAQGKSA